MTDTNAQANLFGTGAGSADAIIINDRCVLRVEGDQRIVVVAGVPLAHFVVGDRLAKAFAMVSLVEQGWADQNDIARAFQRSPRTVRRYQRRYDEGGLARLGRVAGYPKGRPRGSARDRAVGTLKAAGLSNRAIAHRLGIHEKSVRKRLRRLGWTPSRSEQMPLTARAPAAPPADPNLSAFLPTAVERLAPEAPRRANPYRSASSAVASEPPPPAAVAPTLTGVAGAEGEAFEPPSPSLDRDPADRRLDRLLAYLGLLDDATPLFRAGQRVLGAGVLLALPSLVETGVFTAARQVYGSIGPAFYGLRTTILTLLLMALLRIKRPEGLKERSPTDLGRVLGLDRAPEVKTVRRKLTALARRGGADRLGRVLAARRVAARGAALGFLYIDGHVRIYYGKRRLPKAHAARLRLAMPATTDYWVNDQQGDPLFVVTAEANAGLVRMLPALLGDVRTLVGERRVTVVFDRGGFSPKLFAELVRQGFDLLTYRKGRGRRVPRRRFHEHVGTFDGREVRYQLADQGVRLRPGLRLRQVTRLRDGHQTPILTSRRDLPAVEVAYRMFERWRQENFFKYLREEFLLDALVDYQVEPDDPMREVPNPAWATADAKLRDVRAEIAQLQERYGAAALANPERARPTMRGFKIAHGQLAQAIRAATQRARALEHQRARIPRRIPVGERTAGQVIKLATERKHLTNLLKMVAYQAESDFLRALAPYYKRHDDEGRTLVQTALASAADLEVTEAELRVTLVPLSSTHRSRAIAAVCRVLNATDTLFPGTRLRLRYAVAEPGYT